MWETFPLEAIWRLKEMLHMLPYFTRTRHLLLNILQTTFLYWKYSVRSNKSWIIFWFSEGLGLLIKSIFSATHIYPKRLDCTTCVNSFMSIKSAAPSLLSQSALFRWLIYSHFTLAGIHPEQLHHNMLFLKHVATGEQNSTLSVLLHYDLTTTTHS